MSFWTNPFKVLHDAADNFATWWKGTTVGQQIDAAAKAAVAELELLAPGIIENAAQAGSTAIISGLAASSPVGALMEAGVLAAEAAFKAAGTTVASTTLTTFVSGLHSAVVASQTAVPVAAEPATPAA